MPSVGPVLERLDDHARMALDQAFAEARALGHSQVGTEHLLLGMLAEGRTAAARALLDCGATLDGCRAKAVEAVASKRHGPPADELTLSDRASRALERAGRLSLRQRCDHIEAGHILVSVLDVEGTAGQVLRGLSVDLARLRRETVSAPAEGAVDEQPVPTDEAAVSVLPRCPGCRADLAATLSHSVMSSAGGDGRRLQWTIAYCSACGNSLAGSLRSATDGRTRPGRP